MDAASPRNAGQDRSRNAGQDRSLVALFSDLWREAATLLRDEAELAKAEISEKVTQAETAVASLAAGALVLYAGFLVLLAAACGGLAKLLPEDQAVWLAPLIVGIVVTVAGVVLLARGRSNLKAEKLAPRRAIHSLRKDTELAKEHAT